MSDDVKQSWQDLGEQMSALGSLIQERLGAPAAEPEETGGADGTTEQIKAALDEVVAATKQLGERIGDAARDDEVRTSAKDTMSSLDEALRSTVDLIAERIEGVVKRSGPKSDA
jgi:enamine deaminase RidA (YjgF/YER057c/UK114 family)